jgi:hypothetical protein
MVTWTYRSRAKPLIEWLSKQVSLPGNVVVGTRKPLVRIILVGASIFAVALGVRFLHLQDTRSELTRTDPMPGRLVKGYRREARAMLESGSILFPRMPELDQGGAELLVHPPGYSVLIALVIKFFGDSDDSLKVAQLLQMTCDAAAALVVFLIAVELFPLGLAAIAGLLAALSNHFAYYSLWLTPTSLVALPILLAIYLTIKAVREPRLWMVIAAGALIGLSCWMRSNGLFLALLVALLLVFLIGHGNRIRYSLALFLTMLVVISPITVRNWILYHRFIPLTIVTGLNLVQGIGELDEEGRFGMPKYDSEAKIKDVEWNGRPDYSRNLWRPDGVERDYVRFRHGLDVIRSHPVWFAGAMLRRAAFILSYNEARHRESPFDSANVPVVLQEPPFGHTLSDKEDGEAVWSSSPAEAVNEGTIISRRALVSLAGQMLTVTGDESEFDDQFAYPQAAVEKNRDYIASVPLRSRGGPMELRVTSANRRVTVGSYVVSAPDERPSRHESEEQEAASTRPEAEMSSIDVPFNTANRNQIRLVISNAGPSSSRPELDLGEVRLFNIGPNPYIATRFVRPLIRSLQRRMFTTAHMIPLIVLGLALIILAGRSRVLPLLLVVPAYYLITHSAFSVEYRYIVVMHYFLVVIAAVPIYTAWRAFRSFSYRVVRTVTTRMKPIAAP